MGENDVPEIAISLAWHRGMLPAAFTTVDGRAIETIHRGTWSHGLGPDFADAMLLFDGREVRSGAVEIHRATRAWTEHGHHRDPRYDAVILHLVARHDGSETRRSDGALVPVAVVDAAALGDADWRGWNRAVWDRFGGEACAPELAQERPELLRAALFELGDFRLAFRAARLEARLTAERPADLLWSEVLDGLGFSANREPMRAVAAAAPIGLIDERLAATPEAERLAVARALLFGVAGFLPFTSADAAFAGLDPAEVGAVERAWGAVGAPWRPSPVAPTAWTRARVRPANHPASRLAAAGALAVNAHTRGGLLPALLDPLRSGSDAAAVLADLASPAGIGADRALDMVASGLIPFALALAHQTDDHGLAEAASRLWETLPASGGNAVTRRALRQAAGDHPLGRLGARGQQGLLQLDAHLCAPRRCYECPVARAMVRHLGTNV